MVTLPQADLSLPEPLPQLAQLVQSPFFADEVAGFVVDAVEVAGLVVDAMEVTGFEVVGSQVPQF